MALYSVEPFQSVLARLKRGRTYREIAAMTARVDPEGKGLSPTRISQLLLDGDPPAPRAMELLAQAFGHSPTIFVEYRLAQARALFDERGPGGLDQAVWMLEALSSVVPVEGRPAARAPRRLAV